MGKNKLTFEPDIRFSLAGKPWSMLFWGRYKVVTGNRFNMNVGTHLGLNFKTSVLPINNWHTHPGGQILSNRLKNIIVQTWA